jgi:phosphotransferase system HPr (HPr) family protein
MMPNPNPDLVNANERDRRLSDRPPSAAAERQPMPADQPYRRTVEVHFPVGLHVRPATLIAQEARKYQTEVFLINGDRRASTRNVFDMFLLGAEQGSQLVLEAGEGSDAGEAVQGLAALFAPEHAELFSPPADPS